MIDLHIFLMKSSYFKSYNYINWLMEKMGVEILDLNQDKIKIALTGCDASLANALRRIMISEVPTLAPHLVSILQNTSVLHDQFLCQRIGLIPFISDSVDDFKYPWQCQCVQKNVEDCQICKSYFILEAKNLNQESMDVTSMHIRPIFDHLKSEDDEIRPIMPIRYYSNNGKQIGIPIVKLAKNQQVKVRFDVQKGIGKMHAKWSPVSLAAFYPDPDIKYDRNIELATFQKYAIANSCPTNVFEVHEGVFQIVNPDNCIYCGQCKKTAEALDVTNLKNYLKIGKKKDRFIFKIETIGSLTPVNVIKKSMKVLRQKLKQLEESIH